MALKSTIFRATLGVADLDRRYFGEHRLTLARHPSETDERMMVRLLAFAMFAEPGLEFGRGLSSEDEPALWRKDLTGDVDLWLEVGLPEPGLLRRAAGRARRVAVLAYGGRAADAWWARHQAALSVQRKLAIQLLDAEASAALAAMAGRDMDVQCTIQDGLITFSDDKHSQVIVPRCLV